VAAVILVTACISDEVRSVFVDRIVGQVHVEIVEVLLARWLVLSSCQSA